MWRALLIVLIVNGLVPELRELIETVVHRVTTGHFAHTPGEKHDEAGAPGEEHGCGPTSHQCRCCASVPMLALSPFSVERADPPSLEECPVPRVVRIAGFAAPLFRPPIA